MKNKFLTVAGIAICAVALGLNLQNAFDGYGVKKGTLHPEVLAQTNTNGGTTSGGGTTGGSTTSGGTSGGSSSGGGSTNTGNGIEQCDILTYNRNYMEAYECVKVNASIGVGGDFKYGDKTYKLGFSVKAGTTVRVPICSPSTGNCCKKTHIDGDVKPI